MAKKAFLKDHDDIEILPITRGELVLDSSGNPALHSNEFLATENRPGLMSAEDKKRIDDLENTGPGADNKVAQVNTTTSDVYRLLFSETATDETKTEGARKSAKLTFNPSTGVLQTTALIGNLDGTYVNKLTGYTKATTVAEITSEDSLSTALGKLELKADTTYDLVRGAYDGDDTIENLTEILKVLEGISDTETIQAIVGKYLPLTGGTIKGVVVISGNEATNVPLNIATPSMGNTGYIRFGAGISTNELGHLGFSAKGEPAMVYEGTVNTLIHSGNIGDYAPVINGYIFSGEHGANALGYSFSAASGLSQAGPTMVFGSGNHRAYLYGRNGKFSFNTMENGTLTGWKTIAFTDSNVASATKLATPRTIWGQSFDGTRNVSGGLFDISNQEFIYSSGSWTRVGNGTAKAGLPTYIDGSTIYFRYSNSQSTGLILNSSGNVTIGGRDLAGTNAKLYVDGSVYVGNKKVLERVSNNLHIGEGIRGSYDTSIFGTSILFNTSSGDNAMMIAIGGNVGIGTTVPQYKLDVVGTMRATGFIKLNSSDSYLLLGGGGHKAISDFLLKSDIANQELNNNLTTITKSLNVTADWMDTGISSTNIPAIGTYIVQVSVHNSTDGIWYGYWSGIMSWYASSTNYNDTDEIILHRAGHAYRNTIYLRTVMQ